MDGPEDDREFSEEELQRLYDAHTAARNPFDELHRQYNDVANPYPGESLLLVISMCARWGVPLPAWAAQAFLESYQNYLDLSGAADCATPLVAAFRTDPKAGTHRPQKKRKHIQKFRVLDHVRERIADGAVIDQALFDEAGTAVGVSGSVAKRWYYELINGSYCRWVE
jgi:hypothetical protein